LQPYQGIRPEILQHERPRAGAAGDEVPAPPDVLAADDRGVPDRGEILRNGENGLARRNTTVRGSGVSISRITEKIELHGERVAGSTMRWKVNLTSSLVSASPLWNFTPSRRWKTNVCGSGFSQATARSGSTRLTVASHL